MHTGNSSAARTRVAYLGVTHDRSTFGAQAAAWFFKRTRNCQMMGLPDHSAVVDALRLGRVEHAVVAIENAVDGVVNESARGVELLPDLGIHVLEEVILPVRFYFAARVRLDLKQELTVYAHPQAKGQCLRLKRRLEALARVAAGREGTVKFVSADSNGAAAKSASAAKAVNCAAITTWDGVRTHTALRLISLTAAELTADEVAPIVKLKLISAMPSTERNAAEWRVGDFRNSLTRFWKLGHGQFPPPVLKPTRGVNGNRTSILLSLSHDAPGGLVSTLEHFSRRGCNLSIIYPIPMPALRFEYSFLLEFEDAWNARGKCVAGGHIQHPDGKLRAGFESLRSSGICSGRPVVLGSYPVTVLPAL